MLINAPWLMNNVSQMAHLSHPRPDRNLPSEEYQSLRMAGMGTFLP
jgi:hypothetical protein